MRFKSTHVHATKSSHTQMHLQIASKSFGGHLIFFDMTEGNWVRKA
jgi:hypothetical protein